jgi:hydroxymethylglutaryl-CoA synthase
MAQGIVSYGAYVPYRRLQRRLIGDALGAPAKKGTRSVASYDEDTTSMGVEASRQAIAAAHFGKVVDSLYFATSTPAYLDKTNATAIHAALGLARETAAYDLGGAVRSAMGALRAASDGAANGRSVLVVTADMCSGLPGSTDEAEGGDAAAAFLFGTGAVLGELIGAASTSQEILDRWRAPGENRIHHWEPRFAEDVLVSLAEEAVVSALKSAGLSLDQIDHLIVSGTHERATRRLRVSLNVRPEAEVDDRASVLGNPLGALPGLLLADVLDQAAPGQRVMMVSVADGADVLVFQTTEALTLFEPERPVARQLAEGSEELSYSQFLTWRSMLVREPPSRPDPNRPAAPASLRDHSWKFGLIGSRCNVCRTMHVPPDRVCLECHSVDDMTWEPLSERQAKVVTFTIDHLAHSLSPPTVLVVVDFDGGGRLQCELADADPNEVAVGLRVEMSFRRLYSAEGVHNYFWKAKPVRIVEGSTP